MTNDQLPIYLNKSSFALPSENWKDIPGFEGSYQASNLGRVRSLDRIVPHPRLKQQFVKGIILSQSVAKNRNIKTGEPMIDLRVSLSIEGHQHYFNTRRIIYQTFINPKLDYSQDGLYVLNIDGNGFNNNVSNLVLETKSSKQKRAITRDRVIPYLATADRSTWPKTYGGYSRRKSISQYDLNGKFLNRFESISAASDHCGIDEKYIIQVAKGVYSQWKGSKWRYNNEEL